MTYDDEKDLLDAGYFPVFSPDAGTIVGWFVPDGTRFIYADELVIETYDYEKKGVA